MLKRKFILQNIITKEYAMKDELKLRLSTQNILFAHLFDTKTEIYEYIKSTKTNMIKQYIIHEVIS